MARFFFFLRKMLPAIGLLAFEFCLWDRAPVAFTQAAVPMGPDCDSPVLPTRTHLAGPGSTAARPKADTRYTPAPKGGKLRL